MVGAAAVSSPGSAAQNTPQPLTDVRGSVSRVAGAGDRTVRRSKATVISYGQWKKNQPIIKARSLKNARMESLEPCSMAYRNNQILLVDDSPSDVELTVHALKQGRLATSIAVAEDGEQALDYLFCRGIHQGRSPCDRPSVILLDLNLPKVDGLEILKAVRADERTRAIPIVILTSSKETKDLVAGYRLGASAFVQKPMDFEEFRSAIKEIAAFWLVRNEPPPAEAFAA
jgi:two-component system response regulator